jgi:hypothetical protein
MKKNKNKLQFKQKKLRKMVSLMSLHLMRNNMLGINIPKE